MFGSNTFPKIWIWEQFGQINKLPYTAHLLKKFLMENFIFCAVLAWFGFYFFKEEVGDDLWVSVRSLQIL